MSSVRSLRTSGSFRTPAVAARVYHATRLVQLPYKDDQDRNSVKPRSTENTKGGTDADMAAQSDASFNPNKTDPGHEKDTAQGNGNPLEVSGANPNISKPQGDSPDKKFSDTSDRKKSSGRGSPTKHGS